MRPIVGRFPEFPQVTAIQIFEQTKNFREDALLTCSIRPEEYSVLTYDSHTLYLLIESRGAPSQRSPAAMWSCGFIGVLAANLGHLETLAQYENNRGSPCSIQTAVMVGCPVLVHA